MEVPFSIDERQSHFSGSRVASTFLRPAEPQTLYKAYDNPQDATGLTPVLNSFARQDSQARFHLQQESQPQENHLGDAPRQPHMFNARQLRESQPPRPPARSFTERDRQYLPRIEEQANQEAQETIPKLRQEIISRDRVINALSLERIRNHQSAGRPASPPREQFKFRHHNGQCCERTYMQSLQLQLELANKKQKEECQRHSVKLERTREDYERTILHVESQCQSLERQLYLSSSSCQNYQQRIGELEQVIHEQNAHFHHAEQLRQEFSVLSERLKESENVRIQMDSVINRMSVQQREAVRTLYFGIASSSGYESLQLDIPTQVDQFQYLETACSKIQEEFRHKLELLKDWVHVKRNLQDQVQALTDCFAEERVKAREMKKVHQQAVEGLHVQLIQKQAKIDEREASIQTLSQKNLELNRKESNIFQTAIALVKRIEDRMKLAYDAKLAKANAAVSNWLSAQNRKFKKEVEDYKVQVMEPIANEASCYRQVIQKLEKLTKTNIEEVGACYQRLIERSERHEAEMNGISLQIVQRNEEAIQAAAEIERLNELITESQNQIANLTKENQKLSVQSEEGLKRESGLECRLAQLQEELRTKTQAHLLLREAFKKAERAAKELKDGLCSLKDSYGKEKNQFEVQIQNLETETNQKRDIQAQLRKNLDKTTLILAQVTQEAKYLRNRYLLYLKNLINSVEVGNEGALTGNSLLTQSFFSGSVECPVNSILTLQGASFKTVEKTLKNNGDFEGVEFMVSEKPEKRISVHLDSRVVRKLDVETKQEETSESQLKQSQIQIQKMEAKAEQSPNQPEAVATSSNCPPAEPERPETPSIAQDSEASDTSAPKADKVNKKQSKSKHKQKK